MGSYGNDVWLSCSWCATPETISYHTDVDGVGLLCERCYTPTPPTRPTSATMGDRSPPPPTPPLSEETKETEAKRQRGETLGRWEPSAGIATEGYRPKIIRPVWEYAETTICGHCGWVPMDQELSATLEHAYSADPVGIIRVCGVRPLVWKFDLGKMTQRRLNDGIDMCTRMIRRIHIEDNSDC